MMRYMRWGILAATVTLGLVVPATAGAQITSISLTGGQLQARGAAVSLQVSVQCESGWNFAFVSANVTQVSGHKLAQGSGSFFTNFPGVPCPASAAVIVNAAGPFAFKQGTATASADVTVFNPTTEAFDDQTVTQTTRLTKK
jgi:hypothetical protein